MDDEITKIVEEGLVRNNVKLFKSTSVREFISKNGCVREAILDNNESINVDIVIVSSGTRPNTEIAKEQGSKPITMEQSKSINRWRRMFPAFIAPGIVQWRIIKS